MRPLCLIQLQTLQKLTEANMPQLFIKYFCLRPLASALKAPKNLLWPPSHPAKYAMAVVLLQVGRLVLPLLPPHPQVLPHAPVPEAEQELSKLAQLVPKAVAATLHAEQAVEEIVVEGVVVVEAIVVEEASQPASRSMC